MFDQIIGVSHVTEALREILQRLASIDATTLLIGEPGTGKNHIAQALHKAGSRREGPFIMLGCEGLAQVSCMFQSTDDAVDSMLESVNRELLEPICNADGGVLYLEHIDALPNRLQSVLLRVLELGEVQVPGKDLPLKVDLRVIASSRRRLRDQVRAGSFRADLYFRLNAMVVELAPLRHRKEDILPLCRHFMRRFAEKHRLEPCSVEPAAQSLLESYPWPENMCELRLLAERLAMSCAGRAVSVGDLPEAIRNPPINPDWRVPLPEEGVNLNELEVDIIRQALAISEGRRIQAARLLGITRHTLAYRMEKHGLEGEFCRDTDPDCLTSSLERIPALGVL
jgi:DNA-binding NtrC family response regulator